MGVIDRPLLAAGYALVIVSVCIIPSCISTCTYPSDLSGIWYTSHETNAELNWLGGNVTSFEYKTTGSTYSGLTYECIIKDGNFYVSKTTGTIAIFGAQFYVYTCWVFTKKSSDKYLYRQAVSQESRVDNARVKVFPSTTTVISASEICDDTEYEKNQYSILIRNGTAAQQTSTCARPLLATGRYTITNDGGTTFCDDNSWIDGCTDKSTLTANYTICNDDIFFSDQGVLYCMYSTGYGESGVYYTTLFNADPSPDESSTYYFTCAVSDTRSDGVYITYYPGDCLNGTYQNATYISESTGMSVVIQTNTTCAPSSSENNLGLILGVVFGLLFLIALIVLLCYIYYIKVYLVKKKRRSSRAGSKVVPDTLPNTSMSQGDKNYRMMFTPAPPRSAAPGGRHQDYRDHGQFGSQTSMRPPVSQLAFYRTPTPRITDSKVETLETETAVEVVTPHTEVTVVTELKSDSKSLRGPVKKKPSTPPSAKSETRRQSAISTPSPVPKEKNDDEKSQEVETDEGVELNDTSSEIREVPPPSAKGHRKRMTKAEQAKRFIAPIAQSFENFYQKQKDLPPNGRSTPKRPLSRERGVGQPPSSAGSVRTKPTGRTTTPKRTTSRDRGASQDPAMNASNSAKTKDMDLDSVLDFDTKRLGEPDGAESGVVMDMEGSLPVFSDSGDLTPEPTRITPRGKIKPKKPKPTPRGMAL